MAYHHQSSLLGQLKVSDPKDIDKDMCLHTYVIELPGVKAEAVKIRVSEGRFLIIEAQGCKETVSPLEAELERIRKKHQEDMEKRERESQEQLEQMKRESQERIEKMKEEMQRESQERIEKMKRESQERVKQIRGRSRKSRIKVRASTNRRRADWVLELSEEQAPTQE